MHSPMAGERRLPSARVTRTIALACAAVQLLLIVGGAQFARAALFDVGLVPARFSGAVVGLDSPVPATLTLLTHMFVHGGVVHLAMNLLFLVWVGQQVEWAVGGLRLALLFIAGGIAGGVLHIVIEPESMVPVVGASGGISAVFAAYALLFAQTGERPARLRGIRISGEMVRALRYAALWVGLQLLTAVAFSQPGGSRLFSGGIAIWSHIGGFLAGLMMALPWLRRRPERN